MVPLLSKQTTTENILNEIKICSYYNIAIKCTSLNNNAKPFKAKGNIIKNNNNKIK